jgi:hypothetical protein
MALLAVSVSIGFRTLKSQFCNQLIQAEHDQR